MCVLFMDTNNQNEQLPDFNAMFVENPVANFAVRVAGESMTGQEYSPRTLLL